MSVNDSHAAVPEWARAPVPTPGVDSDPPTAPRPEARPRPADARVAPGVATGRGVDPVVDPRVVRRLHVAALEARVATLEARLSAARTRHERTVDRYEYVLERRTELYRSWLAAADSPPGEFEWVGRRDATGTNGDGDGRTVTDGGRERGLLSRTYEWVRDRLR